MVEIKTEIKSPNEIYLIFDETTDSCGRFVLNVLLGPFFIDKRSSPSLIATVLLEKTNAVNVNLKYPHH